MTAQLGSRYGVTKTYNVISLNINQEIGQYQAKSSRKFA